MATKTMIDRYILVGQTPVPEPDLLTWARWFEERDNRRVALTRVFDIAEVSTVFLGLDHGHARFFPGLQDAPPVLFESMIFWDGECGEECDRCSTWAQAERMHRAMVEEARSPRSVWAYVLRIARENWQKAWGELRKALREI